MHEFDITPIQVHSVDLDLGVVTPQAGATPPIATATMTVRAPTVTAIRHATVNAVRATGFGSASIVIPGGSESGFVSAPRASAAGSARVPVIGADATVIAVRATASSTALVPGSPINIITDGVRAGAASLAPIPVIMSETVLTGGGPATANLIAIPPSSVTGAAALIPVFASVGAEQTLVGPTTQLPVPSGVVGVASECILAFLWHTPETVTWTPPTGFTEATGSPITVTGVEAHTLRVYWKRPTAADTGTYNFTSGGGLTGVRAYAARFTGCLATGTQVGGAGFIDTDASNNTSPAASISTGPNRLAIWVVNGNGAGTTFSGGFTERADDTYIAFATLPVTSAGTIPPTGSLVATTENLGNTRASVWLGTLLSPGFPP